MRIWKQHACAGLHLSCRVGFNHLVCHRLCVFNYLFAQNDFLILARKNTPRAPLTEKRWQPLSPFSKLAWWQHAPARSPPGTTCLRHPQWDGCTCCPLPSTDPITKRMSVVLFTKINRAPIALVLSLPIGYNSGIATGFSYSQSTCLERNSHDGGWCKDDLVPISPSLLWCVVRQVVGDLPVWDGLRGAP
jgi:hypothetical protein